MNGAKGLKLPLPRGFLALAVTEYWERFSLAGFKSVLTLVLIDQILGKDRSKVVGTDWSQHVIEATFGPLTTIGLASQIYGLTNALLYLSVPLGGLLGDTIAGRRGAVYVGGGAMFAALGLMIQERYFLLALPLFALGAGTIKGNLSAFAGGLFNDDAGRRHGFAIYLGFLNAGVICGPLLCGALVLRGGWRLGLGAAAIAIALGLTMFHIMTARSQMFEQPALPASTKHPDIRRAGGSGQVGLLLAALLAIYLCFAAYEQVGNIFLVWARGRSAVDFPVAWLISFDGIFTLALIPLSQLGLRTLARHGRAIGASSQIMLGCGAGTLGNLVLAAASWIYADQVPLAGTLAYLLLIDCAIVLAWPAGLSLIMEAAPRRSIGFWVGLFYLHGFFANLWVGFGGTLYERMAPASFWSLHAALAAAGALVAAASMLVPRRGHAHQEAITTSA
ncbi:MFS transporter [Sphingomonas psychrotolerans]|uniref:MFS transporter n=1 Tax=Sphingomonas psychrotolerans TaxID=1327635 RepID=A0ABU3MZ01_9SPHN|nr:MFS transporter [Sphingomonas psychrotolerans]MDT8757196.1 MFS transporter [Sphingomonas psychrotolerans]